MCSENLDVELETVHKIKVGCRNLSKKQEDD